MKKTVILILAAAMLLTLCACGGKSEAKIDIETVWTEIDKTVSHPELYRVSAEKAENHYGVAEADCVSAIIAICSDNLLADEIWLVEAKDEAAAKRVYEAAEYRLKEKAEETESYLPEQYKVVKAAKLVRNGNYVALFISPDAESMVKLFK